MANNDWKWLKKVNILNPLSDEELKILSDYIDDKGYVAGQTIYGENNKGGNLYFIKSGKVRVLRKGKDIKEHELAIMGIGSTFGEMTFFDKGKHTASVEAIEDSIIGVLSIKQFEKLTKNSPQTAYLITKGMLLEIQRIMREMNARYTSLMEYMHVFGK
ncbi:MAG TPA: hypothetical protein DD641_01030 [Deltaproteobacteria bacterium]|nr:hypothetical protein [Deltaproteobacteria bacterium]